MTRASTPVASNDGSSSLVGQEEGPTSGSRHLDTVRDVPHCQRSALGASRRHRQFKTAGAREGYFRDSPCVFVSALPSHQDQRAGAQHPPGLFPTATVGTHLGGSRQAKATEQVLVGSWVLAATPSHRAVEGV